MADDKGAARAKIDCLLLDPCGHHAVSDSARIGDVRDIRERWERS